MRESVVLNQQLRETINKDIAERTKIHQSKVAALKTARTTLVAMGAAAPTQPLIMLAHGDSWFDYPLSGNSPSLHSTDIISQLQSLGTILISTIEHIHP